MNAEDHLLFTTKTCPCDKTSDTSKCPVCDWGLQVCEICGGGEAQLEESCIKRISDDLDLIESYSPTMPLSWQKYHQIIRYMISRINELEETIDNHHQDALERDLND